MDELPVDVEDLIVEIVESEPVVVEVIFACFLTNVLLPEFAFGRKSRGTS
jgi:hypothetical protein